MQTYRLLTPKHRASEGAAAIRLGAGQKAGDGEERARGDGSIRAAAVARRCEGVDFAGHAT